MKQFFFKILAWGAIGLTLITFLPILIYILLIFSPWLLVGAAMLWIIFKLRKHGSASWVFRPLLALAGLLLVLLLLPTPDVEWFPKAGGSITTLTLSTDGRIIFAGDSGGGFSAWETRSGRRISQRQGDHLAISASMTPFGLATISQDRTLCLQSVTNSEPVCQLLPGAEQLAKAHFSQHSSFAAITTISGVTEMWDIEPTAKTSTLQLSVRGVSAVSPMGDAIYVVSPKQLHILNQSGYRILNSTPCDEANCQITAAATNGSVLAVATSSPTDCSQSSKSTLNLLSPEDGSVLAQVSLPRGEITELKFSETDPMLLVGAVASYTTDLFVWNLRTGANNRIFDGRMRNALTFNFLPDGRTVAAGDNQGGIHLVNIFTGEINPPFTVKLGRIIAWIKGGMPAREPKFSQVTRSL